MKEIVKNIIEKVKAGDIEPHFRLLLRMAITDIKIPQLNIAGTVTEAIDNLCGEKTIEVTNIEAENFDKETAEHIIKEIYHQILKKLEGEVKS